jgi:hypothetical protein
MSDNLKVTLAYPYTDADGVNHRADTTVSLPVEVAQNLLWNGLARAAEKTPTTKATKATSATEKKE